MSILELEQTLTNHFNFCQLHIFMNYKPVLHSGTVMCCKFCYVLYIDCYILSAFLSISKTN